MNAIDDNNSLQSGFPILEFSAYSTESKSEHLNCRIQPRLFNHIQKNLDFFQVESLPDFVRALISDFFDGKLIHKSLLNTSVLSNNSDNLKLIEEYQRQLSVLKSDNLRLTNLVMNQEDKLNTLIGNTQKHDGNISETFMFPNGNTQKHDGNIDVSERKHNGNIPETFMFPNGNTQKQDGNIDVSERKQSGNISETFMFPNGNTQKHDGNMDVSERKHNGNIPETFMFPNGNTQKHDGNMDVSEQKHSGNISETFMFPNGNTQKQDGNIDVSERKHGGNISETFMFPNGNTQKHDGNMNPVENTNPLREAALLLDLTKAYEDLETSENEVRKLKLMLANTKSTQIPDGAVVYTIEEQNQINEKYRNAVTQATQLLSENNELKRQLQESSKDESEMFDDVFFAAFTKLSHDISAASRSGFVVIDVETITEKFVAYYKEEMNNAKPAISRN